MTAEQEQRDQRRKRLERRADWALARATSRIMAYHPVGVLSDLGCLCAQPKRGHAFVSVPHLGQTFVFKTRSQPSEYDLIYSECAHAKSEKLRRIACTYFWCAIEDNRTIGNRRVLMRGERLAQRGLLDANELRFLGMLQRFWKTNPTARTGCVKGQTIKVFR